jgi:hypothetical protein
VEEFRTMTHQPTSSSERGGAGVKFLIIFVVLILAANAGYNYIPVAYAGESFRQEMQTAVVNGLALPGRLNPVDVIKAKVQRAAADNDVPSDAVIEIKQVGNVVQAHAVYTKPVSILPFGIYTYTYHFDHTATPTGYLLKESK